MACDCENTGTSCCDNPCATDCITNTPANESLPSQVANFIYHFFGSVTKTAPTPTTVAWELPCDLADGIPGYPRIEGEGLACFFKRVFETGIAGLNGIDAYAVLTADFIQPAVGDTVDVEVDLVDPFAVDMYVWAGGPTGTGIYQVVAIDTNLLLLTLRNLYAPPYNLSAGQTFGAGSDSRVVPAGPVSEGPQGPPGNDGATGVAGPAGATGAAGNKTVLAFRRSSSAPATPTGDNTPSGWYLTPPAVNGNPLWMTVGVETGTGTLVGSWSTPIQIAESAISASYLATLVSSSTPVTMTGAYSVFVYTGSASASWTLPAVVGFTGMVALVKNRGTGALTLSGTLANKIFADFPVSSLTIGPGEAVQFNNDGTYWLVS